MLREANYLRVVRSLMRNSIIGVPVLVFRICLWRLGLLEGWHPHAGE